MNLCTKAARRALLTFGILLISVALTPTTAGAWTADLQNHHEWMIRTDDAMSVDELLEAIPTDAGLTEIAVHWGGNVTVIRFDGGTPSADELNSRITDEVNFGYETMRSTLVDQLLTEHDGGKLESFFNAIGELDASGQKAHDGEWTISLITFDSKEKAIAGAELRPPRLLNPELDLNRPDPLKALPSCSGYWHAPTHGSISVTTSQISGTLNWANASREFSVLNGFEFEIAFVGQPKWGGGYTSFSATWPCYYPYYDSDASGAAQYEAGCGTPQDLRDNFTYSYIFRLKNSSKPDTKLSLKSQRNTAIFAPIQCCSHSSGCNYWYQGTGGVGCQTAYLNTWKNAYSW